MPMDHDIPPRAQQAGALVDGNASCLEAYIMEKVVIDAAEFCELHGHVLVIKNAPHGLRLSAKSWNNRLAACLKKLCFEQCTVEPSIG